MSGDLVESICEDIPYVINVSNISLYTLCKHLHTHKTYRRHGGLVVKSLTPEQEVGGSKPTSAMLCP